MKWTQRSILDTLSDKRVERAVPAVALAPRSFSLAFPFHLPPRFFITHNTMRLLRTNTAELELIEAWGEQIPSYAILSHTWSTNPDAEVLFHDVRQGTAEQKPAYTKVRCAIVQALQDGHGFIWIDTCCIDKTSSAELTEAINSMYAYYQKAQVCYVHLSDVAATEPDREARIAEAKWWTRGWTLQELLAPPSVTFFSNEWSPLGSRHDLSQVIETITGISEKYFSPHNVESASLARRMS